MQRSEAGDARHQHFLMAVLAAFDHHVALGQVLQNLGQALAAVERRRNLVGIGARKLKKDVRANPYGKKIKPGAASKIDGQ